MILSFRGDQYSQNPSIISDSIGIPNGGEKKWENEWGGGGGGTESYSYRRGCMSDREHLIFHHIYWKVNIFTLTLGNKLVMSSINIPNFYFYDGL